MRSRFVAWAGVVCLALAVTWWARAQAPFDLEKQAPPIPVDAAVAAGKEAKMEKAMFGAGCFWGVEVTFRNTKGVVDAAVGYSGGQTENPTYKQVCYEETGHAEVVYVTYDPAVISYEDLLKVFWENHDPTQLNRQGPDHGSQYRSVIFYYSDEQKATAEKSKAALNAANKFGKPVVTEIAAAKTFYPAEDYHQRYLEKRGLASCHVK
jgi:peptide-methionine (S)-S-oxide reductase